MNKEYIHIILADDDEDDRLFFTDAFEELKISTKVQTYNDGSELMEYLNSEDAILPEILFLDLNMPKKNGIECLKEIKANDKFSAKPSEYPAVTISVGKVKGADAMKISDKII